MTELSNAQVLLVDTGGASDCCRGRSHVIYVRVH